MNEEVTSNILEKLSREYVELIKKKHGSTREILLGDLILAIIKFNKAKDTCEALNISPQTFNRSIKKAFPGVKLNGGGETWTNYLLNLSDYKRCHTCNSIKLKINFSKDKTRQDELDSLCKSCKKQKQEKYYYDNLGIWGNYYKENKEEYIARNAKRRAKKLNATPAWGELELIKEFYKNKPEGSHVDHIIPLQGEKVCGLHVLGNLQYLTAEENLSKSNKFEI